MNRYGQGSDNFDTCVSVGGLQRCIDRYGQGKVVHAVLPFMGGGDEFDACFAKVRDRRSRHAAQAQGSVLRADAGIEEDAEDAALP
jgi:hypothetical protein